MELENENLKQKQNKELTMEEKNNMKYDNTFILLMYLKDNLHKLINLKTNRF